MVSEKERLEKIKEGLQLLKDAGVVASIAGDGINLEIITENLSIRYKTDKLLEIKLEEENAELDLTEYGRIRNLYFVDGLPIINMDIFPRKLIMYPEKIKRKYGE